MKQRANPMHLEQIKQQVRLMQAAPRCSATSKRSGRRCRCPAVKGRKVCRMHGARAGAPKGKANGAWRHGRSTGAAITERRVLSRLLRAARSTARSIEWK